MTCGLLASCSPSTGGSTGPVLGSTTADRPIDVRAEPRTVLPGSVADAMQDGPLAVEAVFALTADDPSFGGLSGLWLSPDGAGMVAVSDRGLRFQASLHHDDTGRLAMIDGWSAAGLPLGPDERSNRGSLMDAEALSGDGAGGLVVSYEGHHRLRRWPLDGLEAIPDTLPFPEGLGEPGNAGIEALTSLPDGRLFGMAERTGAPGGVGLLAWTMDDRAIEPLTYVPAAGFAPTGADRLDDTIYVVERAFSLLGGFRSRIVAMPSEAVRPGARVEGQELAAFRWGVFGENFEAIAARRGPDGRVLLYLVADDNFFYLQETLLVQLSLSPDIPTS